MHHGLIIPVYILKCGGVHTAQRQSSTRIHIGFCANLLPSLRRLCFYPCLSFILFIGGEYLTRYPPPDQVHPPGPGTPQTRYTPPGPGTPLRTRYPPDQVHPRQDQVHPPGAEHAGRYGQRAGGPHPTGMQSCQHLCLSRCLAMLTHHWRWKHLPG